MLLKKLKPEKSISPVKREFSAGGVVFKRSDVTLFLLINPTKSKRWQLPKGHIEKGESSNVAAVREVEEEGGVKARIVEKIGNQKLFFTWQDERIFKIVTFYLMEYISGDSKNLDVDIQKAEFLEFENALERLTFKNDKLILTQAKTLLEKGIQESLV